MRLVDDFSEFGINSATGTCDKLRLGGIDEIVATAVLWHRTLLRARVAGTVQVTLREGEVLRGALHPHWCKANEDQLVGKTWDLQDAYKQLALKPAHRFAAVVATPHPEKETQLWASIALPFGACPLPGAPDRQLPRRLPAL